MQKKLAYYCQLLTVLLLRTAFMLSAPQNRWDVERVIHMFDKVQITLEQCRGILVELYKEILPRRIRKKQTELSERILTEIHERNVTLMPAESGADNMIAALTAAVLAKRGRLCDEQNMALYPEMPYAAMSEMPIVITVSSIAQQNEVLDCIPILSQAMLEQEIISTPLIAALRKGREHYACMRRLQAHIQHETDIKIKRNLTILTKPFAPADIAEVKTLPAEIKRKICVPERCDSHCPQHGKCPFHIYYARVLLPKTDIQVCNHNYFLADTLRRRAGQKPLIPNYQILIIDDAHRFLQAAHCMYGKQLSEKTIPSIKNKLSSLLFRDEKTGASVNQASTALLGINKRLFEQLSEHTGNKTHQYAQAILRITTELLDLLPNAPLVGGGVGVREKVIWELTKLRNCAALLVQRESITCRLYECKGERSLKINPQDLDRRLREDLWSKGFPVIISGSFSSAEDFERVKTSLGI